MSLRRVVAKHLGAKVFLFFIVFRLSLSFPVSSAMATIVAHAKCLIFSRCVQPKQTTVAAARDIKHILSCAPKHFSPGGSPRLHKALMIWLYVESHELPTESNKTDIYSYVGRALGSELNKVKLYEESHTETHNCARCLFSYSASCSRRFGFSWVWSCQHSSLHSCCFLIQNLVQVQFFSPFYQLPLIADKRE